MKRIVGFALAITVFYFFHASPVGAQSLIPLTVGPARQQITINPGEEAQMTVRFYNQSESALPGLLRVGDFIVEDNQGTPRIVEDVNQSSPKFSGSEWITLPYDRMAIAANDKTVVQFTLRVPADAKPGGRYVAVYFEPTTPVAQTVTESGASISPRVASLIYIRVNGPISENALIANIFSKSFYEFGPIEVTAEIVNKGDYHIRPRGAFVLKNMFGAQLEQTKLSEGNIFPDATRTYTGSVGKKWLFGRYRLELLASYGEKNQTMTRGTYVWVFPWRIAVVVLLALLITVLVGRSTYANVLRRESKLEDELAKEKEEIEKLKEELKRKEE